MTKMHVSGVQFVVLDATDFQQFFKISSFQKKVVIQVWNKIRMRK